jgi:hypothetical protein
MENQGKISLYCLMKIDGAYLQQVLRKIALDFQGCQIVFRTANRVQAHWEQALVRLWGALL